MNLILRTFYRKQSLPMPEEGAIERSRADYQKFLPDGIHTGNNYLFKVLSPQRVPVGILWLATEELTHSAFIYDIEIDADYRRQGFATQALNDADEFARSLGMKSIGLHVFQQNRAAQILYTSLGYKTVSVNMAKPLE